jgi:hypothetical protein
MSAKETFIKHFRHARATHISWLNQIKLMVSGVVLDKGSITLDQTQSSFGIWLYNEAMSLSTSNSKNVLDDITRLHSECYDHYITIHNILYKKKSSGFFQTILGGKNRASEHEVAYAQQYYEALVAVSDSLLKRLRVFESQLLSIPEKEFENYSLSDDIKNISENLKVENVATHVSTPNYYRGQRID